MEREGHGDLGGAMERHRHVVDGVMERERMEHIRAKCQIASFVAFLGFAFLYSCIGVGHRGPGGKRVHPFPPGLGGRLGLGKRVVSSIVLLIL